MRATGKLREVEKVNGANGSQPGELGREGYLTSVRI
jgi:hypothetical protein